MPQSIFKLKRFFFWWLVDTPKNIFVTLKRFIYLLNNDISFTLNIRLLFTPLFGDYTFIGHIIGFCIRIVQIISGSVLMIVITFSTLILPLVWWGLPFYAFSESIILSIVGLIFAYFIWYILNVNKPAKKTYQLAKNIEVTQSFRPIAYEFMHKIQRNWSSGINALCRSSNISEVLLRSELSNTDFVQMLKESKPADISKLKQNAFDIAKDTKARYVEPEHIFESALKCVQNINNVLATFGSDLSTISRVNNWMVERRESLDKRFVWQPDYELIFVGGIGKGMTGVITPKLDEASVDYTRLAQNGKMRKIVAHTEKIKEIAEMLKGTKNNILIIGPAGSGKTSIVKGIAQQIIEGTAYETLRNKRIVSLELSRLISGTTTSGQIAQKINKIIDEVRRSRDIILFIDEIHTTVSGMNTDTAETSSIFSILEPIISDEQVQVIGATTIHNYNKFIEPNEAFSRLFHIVEIEQTSPKETLEVLIDNSERLERQYGIKVTLPALDQAIKLSNKLIKERVNPDKALDITERTALKVTSSGKVLDTEAVERELATMTHIPVENISAGEAEKLLNIEDKMRELVIGQDHALKIISAALRRARVGIRDEDKPIASFLFVGTTGVGKTQTAKALAKSYFGNEKSMIRIDMSEYQQVDSINRLIGSPDGSMRGYLTDQVRQHPFSVVLLDEIEKAHPNILLLFLQVLDEGIITDATGMKISFSNTLIIATSNVGTKEIQKLHEENKEYSEIKEHALVAVRNHYAPEFLNRFTSIVVYRPLDADSVRKITLMLLNNVKNNVKEKSIEISFKKDLLDKIIEKGHNTEWGARPLRRVIEDSVESYIATKILTHEIKEGDILELGTEVFEEVES